MSDFTANWNYPTAIRFGPGRIAELPAVCGELNIERPLLVTDTGLADHEIVQNAVALCTDAGLSCAVFSGVEPNPSGENVELGVAAFHDGNHDGVIAFGGGSSLDAGKAVAFMARQTRSLWDFEDVGDNWTRAITENLPPVIAVPTTSGTGSEVGRASVITDREARVKKIIFHPRMLPEIVIGDPDLTLGLPKHITAATGMDALSHNLEAFFAPFYHPLARGIAVEGARLVKEWLPAVCDDGANAEARAQMMVASMAGATAFQRGLGGMHALAHSLGALYGAHHGLLNAILMPYVLEANRSAIEADAAYLARCLDLDNGLDGLIAWVLDLRSEVGIPETLREIDIDDTDSELIGKMAVRDPAAGGNPIPFTESQYEAVFRAAVSA
ncbi:MAG: iron-containing alcohol dehydrogenase [Candidatus Hydrogenedentes bacterium]|nr:iron-containing alcohol dehydrogenase [Candidatus Hydrogenedentota bacterium]